MSDYLKSLEKHASETLKPAVEGQLTATERIALFKRFLNIEEERILIRHRSGAGGLEIARDRSNLIDTILRAILKTSVNALKAGSKLPISLVATGGYGRSLLNPRSDIDILFLLPRASNKLPKALQDLVQDILYLLWDMGFKVGHACRSISECIEQARLDQENKTSLMDARLVCGDDELFENFQSRFAKECIDKGQEAFFELRRQDMRSRHEKYSHTVFLQEPNVKESCGGLRDYQSIQWVARVKRGSSRLEDLVECKLLTAAAFRELEAAFDFIESPRARNKIKQWFSRERREDAIENGREELSRELRSDRLPVHQVLSSHHVDDEAVASGLVDGDALLAAVGEGHLGAKTVAQKLAHRFRTADPDSAVTMSVLRPDELRRGSTRNGVHVEGFDDTFVRLSKCCTPVPGDEIIGFLTRGRGVSVHRSDCSNAESLAEDQAARLVDVEWDGSSGETVFRAAVEVMALDRSKLLRDVANALSEQHVNIVACSTHTGHDRVAKMRFEFELADPGHLDSVIRTIKRIDGVYDAARVLHKSAG